MVACRIAKKIVKNCRRFLKWFLDSLFKHKIKVTASKHKVFISALWRFESFWKRLYIFNCSLFVLKFCEIIYFDEKSAASRGSYLQETCRSCLVNEWHQLNLRRQSYFISLIVCLFLFLLPDYMTCFMKKEKEIKVK